MYTTTRIDVLGSPMDVLVFSPQSSGPLPAVIVAQHLPVAHAGLETDPFTIDIGERLAAQGYVAVIPFLFHRWPLAMDMIEKAKAWRDDWNIADLDAVYQFTTGLPGVDPGRVGILGHCWGGRVAWLGACLHDFKAAAMFYGGRIKLPLGEGAQAPIKMADRITCPMLGVFGNEDKSPSPEEVEELREALKREGVSHEFHQYDGAGHGFQDFCNPDRYRAEQSDDAWNKLFDFFARNLQ
jgi:carboxymethylenebutenolidase